MLEKLSGIFVFAAIILGVWGGIQNNGERVISLLLLAIYAELVLARELRAKSK